MAKKTVLQLVQNILSSLDLDNVNSISDTEEATQVSLILERSYYALIARKQWKFMEKTMNLQSVGNALNPTKIKIPDNVNRITCLRYKLFLDTDNIPESPIQWKQIPYKFPCDFIDHVQRRDPNADNILTVDNDDGVEMYIQTDKAPEFWTSFDDTFIYFDNLDRVGNSTMSGFRSSINAIVEQPWVQSDTFVPVLPQDMFTALEAEARSIAWTEFKQTTNAKAEQEARRQYIIMRENEPRVDEPRVFVNYGYPRGKSRRHSRRLEDIRRPLVG